MSDLAALHDQQKCQGSAADVACMRELLKADPEALERPQQPAQFCGALTPLQSAVHVGHELCAQFLIESGAHVDAWNERGYSALYVATYAREPSLVSLLLRHGASPNYQPLDGSSEEQMGHSRNWYLYLACSFGFIDIARSLARHGAAPEEFWPTGYSSAAQVSALKNHPECLLLALRHGAVTDFPQLPRALQFEGLRHYSLLHHSIAGKSFHSQESVDKVVQIWHMLRQFGADFWFRDSKGRTVMDRLLRKHFPQEISENLESTLRNIMAEPLSLQSLSRIVIRRSMGVDCHKNIHKLLCLPPALISLLNYMDFETE